MSIMSEDERARIHKAHKLSGGCDSSPVGVIHNLYFVLVCCAVTMRYLSL